MYRQTGLKLLTRARQDCAGKQLWPHNIIPLRRLRLIGDAARSGDASRKERIGGGSHKRLDKKSTFDRDCSVDQEYERTNSW